MESNRNIRSLPLYRQMGWLTIIGMFAGLALFTMQWVTGKLLPSDQSHAPLLFMFFSALFTAILYLLFGAYVRYSWDEEGVIRRSWLGNRRMKWSDVTHLRIRRLLGLYDYILYDRSGKRLIINIAFIGEDNSLSQEISKRLKGLIEQSIIGEHTGLKDKNEELENMKIGPVWMGPDIFVYKEIFSRKTIPYREIRYVFYYAQVGSGVRLYHFSDGHKDRLILRSTARDFDRIIYALKRKMTATKWFDEDIEMTPENKIIFIKRELSNTQKDLRDDFYLLIFIGCPGIVFMLWFSQRFNNRTRYFFIFLTFLCFYTVFDRWRTERRKEKFLIQELKIVEEQQETGGSPAK